MGQGHNLNSQAELEHFNAIIAEKWLRGEQNIRVEFPDSYRTKPQQNAIEVFCRELASHLNAAGFDMRAFPWKEGVDVPWDQASVKKRLWGPVQEAMLDEKSTTKLTTTQVNDVYQVVSRHIAQTTGVSVAFPSARG